MRSLFDKMIIRFALVTLICGPLSACGISVDEARKTFPPISKERKLGTTCSTSDSASVKRAPMHPLGPTGGWYSANNNLVDYSRTMQRDSNHLEMNEGGISGYVRFDTPGYLVARSYDDFFGDVYCGWSPDKLYLKPSKQYVFVSLGTCSVGDGGLDQVHEVAWFPENSSEGNVIFSTAHSSPGLKLSAVDIYRPVLLGNEWQINHRYATQTVTDYLQRGDLSGAKSVIHDALNILAKLKDSMDGVTRKKIPALELHRNEWASMLSYKLGMSLGEPGFDPTLIELHHVLDSPAKGYTGTCDTIRKMLPLYVWLSNEAEGKQSKIPDARNLSESIVGYEPIYVANYLQSKTPEESFIRRQGATGLFWSAVKRFLSKDFKGSEERLDAFLKEKFYSLDDGFEIAAAAKLKQRLKVR